MRTTKPTWVKFGAELLELDAVYSLAGTMDISQVESGAYIALLIAFAIANADDDGQIDHLTDRTIERACYWPGERGALMECFKSAGILSGERDSDDEPLAIEHGLWRAVAGKTIDERNAARRRKAKERAKDKA